MYPPPLKIRWKIKKSSIPKRDLVGPAQYHRWTQAQRKDWSDSLQGKEVRGEAVVKDVVKQGRERFEINAVAHRKNARTEKWDGLDSITDNAFGVFEYRIYTESRKALELEKGERVFFRGRFKGASSYHNERSKRFGNKLHIKIGNATLF